MQDFQREMLKDLLWGMYQENTTHGRHHETQRSTVTNAIIVLAGALIALVTFDKALNPADIPATVFLIGLGVFGAVFSAQHYAKYSRHMARARQYRNALDTLLPNLEDAADLAKQVDEVYDKGKTLKRKRKRPVRPRRTGILAALKSAGDEAYEQSYYARLGEITPGGLHALWVALHSLVALLGGVLTVLVLSYPQGSADTEDSIPPPRVWSTSANGKGERFHDPGKPITVPSGEHIRLALWSDRSTGYRWVLVDSMALGPLRLVTSSYDVRAGGDKGKGGIEIWTFQATARGQGAVSMVYIRPWENTVPRDTIRLRIRVR